MALHRIGNYELLGELGRGGMGVVYRGVDSFIKRPVAIKTIYLTEIQEDSERQFLRERLYREAQSAGILSHPNIVTIYQIGEQDDITYIVMEYVEGQNLAQLLRSKEKPTFEALLSIFEQTAVALDHAHSQGVIHRDIKPANIIVRGDGIAKITDFGVAKIASQTVTRTGMTLGTPHFMAPEQIQGKQIDGRADQYALGVVVYEIVTGKKPFTADSMTTLIFKIVTDPVDPKRDNPNVSDAAAQVLKRALAKDPAERYPNCNAMIQAFRAAVGIPSTGVLGSGFGLPTPTTGTPYHSGHPTGTPTGTPYQPGQQPSTQTGMSPQESAHRASGVGTQPITPTPTPTPAPPPNARGATPPSVQVPQIPPQRPSAPAAPSVPAQGEPAQRSFQARPSTPAAVSPPVPQTARSNKWLIPVAAVVGIAIVGGIFAVISLLNEAVSDGTGKIASTQGGAVVSSPASGAAQPNGASGGSEGATTSASANQSSTPASSSGAGNSRSAAPAATPASAGGGAPPRPGASPGTSRSGAQSPPEGNASGGGNATFTPPPPARSNPSSQPAIITPPQLPPSSGNRSSQPPRIDSSQTPASRTPSSSSPNDASGTAGSAPPNRNSPTGGGQTASGNPSPPEVADRGANSTRAPVFTPPRPIVRVPAIYPAQARKDGVSGSVLLQAVVNENGQPTSVNVVRGIRPDLDQAARDALSKWRFQPGSIDGKPSEARVNVEISFSLVQEQRKPISLKNP